MTGEAARSSWPALASRLPSWMSATSSTTIPVNSVLATRLTMNDTSASAGDAAISRMPKTPLITNTTAAAGISTEAWST